MKKLLLLALLCGALAFAQDDATSATPETSSETTTETASEAADTSETATETAAETGTETTAETTEAASEAADTSETATETAAEAGTETTAETTETASEAADTSETATETAAETSTETETGTETETSTESTTETETASEASDMSEAETVGLLELLSQDDRLSTFTLLLAASDLLADLENGEYTLFAPTNYAFNLATEELVDVLADSDAIIALLRGHIVAGALPQAELSDGMEITSANDASFTVKSDGVSVVIANANVLQADITAGSSLIHVVDSVLR